jgi:hypothetical protein
MSAVSFTPYLIDIISPDGAPVSQKVAITKRLHHFRSRFQTQASRTFSLPIINKVKARSRSGGVGAVPKCGVTFEIMASSEFGMVIITASISHLADLIHYSVPMKTTHEELIQEMKEHYKSGHSALAQILFSTQNWTSSGVHIAKDTMASVYETVSSEISLVFIEINGYMNAARECDWASQV